MKAGHMTFQAVLRPVFLALVASLLSSCASISVKDVNRTTSARPTVKPTHFYVAPFTYANANLKGGIMRKTPESLGAESQQILTKYLLSEISKNLGPVSVVRAGSAPSAGGWLIAGQITRVSEGNRLVRMAIGLGAGGTKLETNVNVRNLPAGNPPFLNFSTTGGSNAMPGAATNPIPFSSAASALAQSTQGLTDDGARTARMIVATIAEYMVQRGWLEPGKVQKPKMASR